MGDPIEVDTPTGLTDPTEAAPSSTEPSGSSAPPQNDTEVAAVVPVEPATVDAVEPTAVDVVEAPALTTREKIEKDARWAYELVETHLEEAVKYLVKKVHDLEQRLHLSGIRLEE